MVVRVGIRGKILAIYAVGFSLLLAVSALVQVLAHQAGVEFEARLNRYYAIQAIQVSVEDLRKRSELYLREPQPALRTELRRSESSLALHTRELAELEGGPGEVAFRAVGVRRGLSAYLDQTWAWLTAYDDGASNAYTMYLAADRVAGYVNKYLGILLSALLEDGTQWYRTSAARNEVWSRVALGANTAALVLATVLALALAGSISRPIRRLALASERMAAGDLDVDEVVARTGDEVEVLAKSFSTMSQNLREMVGGLHDNAALVGLDRDLKEARFFALQSRLRPHFLFNALNTVARSALLEGAAETEQLTRRLATLMRYSLGVGQNFVTVDEELGIVREYLLFQGIRFGERLRWTIVCDPGAGAVLVPRFTLQPLVENAVLHGIEPTIAGGTVSVVVRVKGDRVTLAVADTGGGMDPSTLARVRTSLVGQGGDSGGVGTASLESRLAYRYGMNLRCSLYSRVGRGTLVVLVVPRGEGPWE